MATVEELIRKESDGTLSFGNYSLGEKKKVSDFEHQGDLYKVKTFKEITKLERNGMFIYESVPGTAVFHLDVADDKLSFDVSATEEAQITLELEPEKEYEIYRDDISLGKMKTNLGGKLVFSVDFTEEEKASIKVVKQ